VGDGDLERERPVSFVAVDEFRNGLFGIGRGGVGLVGVLGWEDEWRGRGE